MGNTPIKPSLYENEPNNSNKQPSRWIGLGKGEFINLSQVEKIATTPEENGQIYLAFTMCSSRVFTTVAMTEDDGARILTKILGAKIV